MFVTSVNFALKPKTKYIMVMMKSVVSGSTRISMREKTSDMRNIIAYDPKIQQMCLFKEVKKVRTMRGAFRYREDRNMPKFDDKGNLIQECKKKRMIPTLDEEPSPSSV